MNIVLADVQTLNANVSESGVNSELSGDSFGNGEFSNLLEKQLERDVELPPGVEYPQAIDYKELNISLSALSELESIALSDVEIPGVWLDYLASEQLGVSAESAPGTPVPGLISDGKAGADLQENIANVIIGDELPGDGNALPPIAGIVNQQSTSAVAAIVSEGQTAQVEVSVPVNPVLRQLAGRTEADLDSKANTQEFDLKNPELSAVLRPSEAGMPLKPVDGLVIKNSEFQAIQANAADLADINSHHRSLTAGPGLQITSATPATALLPTSLETLTVSNSRDTAAWGSGIGDRVQWMINQKLNSATIRLDPPMLGRLDVHIQVSDDVTNVTINTQHAQTRDIVDNASFRLREYLQENGYQNVNVDVSHQQQQQASQELEDDTGQSIEDEIDKQQVSGSEVSQAGQYYSSDSVVDYFV